jgi:hypothetical protein
MHLIRGRSGTRTCAKGTLLGLTRTGGLLIAAVLASILLVDLPMSTGPWGGTPSAPAYVPASERWIELGAPLHGQTRRSR